MSTTDKIIKPKLGLLELAKHIRPDLGVINSLVVDM